MTNRTTTTTHKLTFISELTYVQRLENRIDDEGVANTTDDEGYQECVPSVPRGDCAVCDSCSQVVEEKSHSLL